MNWLMIDKCLIHQALMDSNFRKVLQVSELGNHLKQARLEKNYSLDDLQQMTKIQKRYLLGIEEGNYAVMPGNFYVRAFIKQYAEAVGLDPDEVFDQFQNEIPNTYEDDIPEQLSRVRTHRQMSKSATKALELLPKVLMAFALIVLAIIVWVLVQKVMNNDQQESVHQDDEVNEVRIETSGVSPSEKEDSITEKEQVEEKAPEQSNSSEELNQQLTVTEKTNSKTVYELTNTDQFTLKITSIGDTWIEVKNSKGNTFFQGMMYEDQEKSFDLSAESNINIVIGDASDTTILINDQEVPYEIDPKNVVRQEMTIVFKKSSS